MEANSTSNFSRISISVSFSSEFWSTFRATLVIFALPGEYEGGLDADEFILQTKEEECDDLN